MKGMVGELERSQLGKLEKHWCVAFIYAGDIVLVVDWWMERHTILEVVQAYVMRWQ